MLKSMWTGDKTEGHNLSKGKANLAGDSSAFGYTVDIAFPQHQEKRRHPKQVLRYEAKSFLTRTQILSYPSLKLEFHADSPKCH
jgi:hypothetical protein